MASPGAPLETLSCETPLNLRLVRQPSLLYTQRILLQVETQETYFNSTRYSCALLIGVQKNVSDIIDGFA
jgi:hypothetical protein